MVRSRLAFAAVFALAVLFVVPDSSDAARRRRRNRNNYDNTPTYSSNYYENAPSYGPFMYGRTQTYSSYYMPGLGNAVALDVRVPVADAQILFDGKKTTQTGTFRRFMSPPLTTGPSYTYEVKATWMENGERVTQTRNVEVFPGRLVFVDLTAAPTTRPMPRTSRERRATRDED